MAKLPPGFQVEETPSNNTISINKPKSVSTTLPPGFQVENATQNKPIAGMYDKKTLARKIIPQFTKGLTESSLPYAKELVKNNPLLTPEQRQTAVQVNEAVPAPEGLMPWLARHTGAIAPDITMAVPFEGVAGAALPPLSKLGRAAIGYGGYTGVKDVLQGKIKEAPLDALGAAAGVWAGGKAFQYAGKGLKAGGKGLVKATSKAQMALKTMTGNLSESELGQFIEKSVSTAIRPSTTGKTSAGQLRGYYDKAKSAIEDIVRNKANLKIMDESGQVVNKLPETLDEMVQALDQRMGDVFRQYDEMAASAGESGVKVDLGRVAQDISKQMDDPAVKIFFPELRQYAKEMVDRIAQEGPLTPETVQRAIAMLNTTLKTYYRNPNPNTASKLVVDVGLVSKLRSALDDAISSVEGEGYKQLKRTYGALKTLMDDVLKRTIVDARKNTKGFFDLTDVLSTGDIVHGLATLNPADIAKGVGMRAAKNWIKGLNDPNRIIKTMFQAVDKTRTKLTPAVQDAEFKVMPELGAQKLLAGPEAKAPTLRIGENVSTTGKGRGLLEASSKYGEGFERSTPEEAHKRIKEFAFKYWNPKTKKIDIPEGQAFSEKEKTILRKMGINPVTGEMKSKPVRSAFQKALERFKNKMKDKRGFAWVGDRTGRTPSWINNAGEEVVGKTGETHKIIASDKPISVASGWVPVRKTKGEYAFDISQNFSLGKQAVENYLVGKKLPDDTKITIQYKDSFYDNASFYLKDLKENNFDVAKTVKEVLTKFGRGNKLKGVVAGVGLTAAGKAEASKENPRKSKIPEALALRAIAGEAEGESYEGMVALAEAIRNRGTLRGVYGLNAPRVKSGKVSKETYAKIKKAWKESETSNKVGGADHWGNDSDLKKFEKEKWYSNMQKTVKIGNHTFLVNKKKIK